MRLYISDLTGKLLFRFYFLNFSDELNNHVLSRTHLTLTGSDHNGIKRRFLFVVWCVYVMVIIISFTNLVCKILLNKNPKYIYVGFA